MSTTPIRLYFQDGCAVRFAFASAPTLDFDVGTVVYGTADDYTGAYEATPTQSTQTFATEGKRMVHDFVVNPIPHNYGLITYNGSSLMVS